MFKSLATRRPNPQTLFLPRSLSFSPPSSLQCGSTVQTFLCRFFRLDIRNDDSWWRLYLLDEAKAVDDFVQVEVCVLPRLHDGLFTLESRRDEKEKRENWNVCALWGSLVSEFHCFCVKYETKLKFTRFQLWYFHYFLTF